MIDNLSHYSWQIKFISVHLCEYSEALQQKPDPTRSLLMIRRVSSIPVYFLTRDLLAKISDGGAERSRLITFLLCLHTKFCKKIHIFVKAEGSFMLMI